VLSVLSVFSVYVCVCVCSSVCTYSWWKVFDVWKEIQNVGTCEGCFIAQIIISARDFNATLLTNRT
jgi:hypothetical protein